MLEPVALLFPQLSLLVRRFRAIAQPICRFGGCFWGLSERNAAEAVDLNFTSSAVTSHGVAWGCPGMGFPIKGWTQVTSLVSPP